MALDETRFGEPLYLDVADDLERVDAVVTRVLKVKELWPAFRLDPNGTLARLGLHPPTSTEINDRANRIFYATLTNRPLVELLVDVFEDFRASEEHRESYAETHRAGLRRGVLVNDVNYDLEALDHWLQRPEVVKRAYMLSLTDLNEQGILQEHYSPVEIEEFVDALVRAAVSRLPLTDHPKLEQWDRNYGLGFAFGAGTFGELGVGTTAAAVVEVILVGTAALWVIGPGDIVSATGAVALDDPESFQAIAVLGSLMDFSSELMIHAQVYGRS